MSVMNIFAAVIVAVVFLGTILLFVGLGCDDERPILFGLFTLAFGALVAIILFFVLLLSQFCCAL